MKKVLVMLVSLAIALTACNHVTVELPNNGCGVSACTNQPNPGGVTIH